MKKEEIEVFEITKENYATLTNAILSEAKPIFKKIDEKYLEVIEDKFLIELIKVNNELPDSAEKFMEMHRDWMFKKAGK